MCVCMGLCHVLAVKGEKRCLGLHCRLVGRLFGTAEQVEDRMACDQVPCAACTHVGAFARHTHTHACMHAHEYASNQPLPEPSM